MNRNRLTLTLAAALALSACSGKDITAPVTPPPTEPPATWAAVTPTVTATPIWDVGYAWDLEASEAPGAFSLASGGSSSAEFTLSVNRGVASARSGVSGQVCVSNTGSAATQGLQVAAQVQRLDGEAYVNVAGAASAVASPSQIAAGGSQCYTYEILFDRDEAATYRTVAQVSITNPQSQAGMGSSSPAAASIVFPAQPQASNAGADVSAAVACPDGFSCSAGTSSWSLTQSETLTYSLNMQDTGAECGTVMEITATFTLEAPGIDPLEVERTIGVETAPCACTNLTGYWKDNSGLNGAPDYVSDKLPIWLGTSGGAVSLQITTAAEARQVFDHFGQSSNGINRLYRHLLTAKLNIANGTSDAAIAQVIADADAFLAMHDSASWASLTPAQRDAVSAMQEALADYSAGTTGPGACS